MEWQQLPTQTSGYVERQNLQQPQPSPPANPQPEPDPPYGIPNYRSSNSGLPSTAKNNSIDQPYVTFEEAAPPQNTPTCWDPPGQRQSWGMLAYDQPPLQYPQPPFGYESAPPYTQPSSADRQPYAWQQPSNPYAQPALAAPQPTLFQQHDCPIPNFAGPLTAAYQQPRDTALKQSTCWDPPIQRQQLVLQQYDQPPSRQSSSWVSPQSWQPPNPFQQPSCTSPINDYGVGRTEPLDTPQDPVTPDLEPNLPVATLLSQIEHLTTTIGKLVSRMDANEYRLGDPHVATRPPSSPSFSVSYLVPVSCDIPQPTIVDPAVLHHVPNQILTSYFAPNSLQPHTVGEQCTYQQQEYQQPCTAVLTAYQFALQGRLMRLTFATPLQALPNPYSRCDPPSSKHLQQLMHAGRPANLLGT